MSRKQNRRLLDESCAWIQDHWDATNLDVPDALLQRWIYEQHEDEEAPSGFHLAVFSFGYLQYDIVCHNVPPGAQRSVALSELLDLFRAWQLKLALTELHRRTVLRIKPMPLFAFPKDEQIETWSEARQPAD